MSGLIKHLALVIGPDAGIQTHMDNEEADQEKPRSTHYIFFAYGRCKKFRPFHAVEFCLCFAL
jgi:hypothetical protein